MEIRVREASAGDAAVLAHLGVIVHEMHVAWYPDRFRPVTVGELERLFVEWLALEEFRAFIAFDGDEPVGYIGTRVFDRPGNAMMARRRHLDIEQIGVAPEARGQGVGRALLEKAREFARSRGLSRLELNVWAKNEAGQKAFAAWGFEKINQRMAMDLPPAPAAGDTTASGSR
jgi:diamine N-acetyltransferase